MTVTSSKKRILHLHASTILGGTELRAFQIAARLKERFELAALFHGRTGPICDYYRQEGISYQVIAYPRLFPVLKLIHRFKPDVIHIFGLKTNILWRPILYMLGYRNLIGHIAGLTNIGSEPSWWRVHLDLWTSPFLKIYLSNSQIVADRLVQYGFQSDKLRVIHNGVVVPENAPQKSTQEPPVILSVGNLRAVKGQRDLIETFKLLQDRGVAFKAWIVGEGPDGNVLLENVKRYGLATRVQFYGIMENTKLLSLMQEADVFVLMSLSEGISGAAMEAMSRGLSVVATDVGGMSELVSQGVEGYLVPIHAFDKAADHLTTLLSQPSLRQSMGKNAYMKIRSQFNLLDTLRDYENLYLNNHHTG